MCLLTNSTKFLLEVVDTSNLMAFIMKVMPKYHINLLSCFRYIAIIIQDIVQMMTCP